MATYQIFTNNDSRGTLQMAQPSGHLREVVEYFWESTFTPDGNETIHSHALPNCFGLLSFNLNQLSWQSVELPKHEPFTFSQSKLFGPLPYSCLCTYPKALKQAGVKLKPGALSLFTRLPAHELHGLKEDLHYFFDTKLLEEQLIAASSFEARVSLMESFLSSHYHSSTPDYRYYLVQEAFSRFDIFMPYGNAIQQLADDLCLTPKSLTRYFQQWVGATPKWCLKAHRFAKAYYAYHESSQGLAYEVYGYHDHSHFYKDALQLTGHSVGYF